MAKITYPDKDNTLPTSNPRRLGRAVDFNEIKTVTNANADTMATKPTPFLPSATEVGAAFPALGTGDGGEIMGGNRYVFSQGGYIPGSEGAEFWPKKTILEALTNNPGSDPDNWRAV